MLVETFVTEAAVEALHEGVLNRLAGGDVAGRDGLAERCTAGIFVMDQSRRAVCLIGVLFSNKKAMCYTQWRHQSIGAHLAPESNLAFVNNLQVG